MYKKTQKGKNKRIGKYIQDKYGPKEISILIKI